MPSSDACIIVTCLIAYKKMNRMEISSKKKKKKFFIFFWFVILSNRVECLIVTHTHMLVFVVYGDSP